MTGNNETTYTPGATLRQEASSRRNPSYGLGILQQGSRPQLSHLHERYCNGRRDPTTTGLQRTNMAVADTLSVNENSLKLNCALPKMNIDPQTYEVFAKDKLLSCEPADVLPLAQRCLLL